MVPPMPYPLASLTAIYSPMSSPFHQGLWHLQTNGASLTFSFATANGTTCFPSTDAVAGLCHKCSVQATTYYIGSSTVFIQFQMRSLRKHWTGSSHSICDKLRLSASFQGASRVSLKEKLASARSQ